MLTSERTDFPRLQRQRLFEIIDTISREREMTCGVTSDPRTFRDVHSPSSTTGSDETASSVDVDNDDDDVSVGCESPPPGGKQAFGQVISTKQPFGQVISTMSQSLKFSIANILRPEFGGAPLRRAPAPAAPPRTGKCSPIDLSKEAPLPAPASPAPSASPEASANENSKMWPAWPCQTNRFISMFCAPGSSRHFIRVEDDVDEA
ncbi:unnamed protein product [Bemisia tabaci]|uniref:Uncharacterized protein n=1 Tax=Bemisia tabaci TaxID=7038 RepID=A0A9P0A153_BEMTA|nr:unnamed protein product [Bemisia tabaci]